MFAGFYIGGLVVQPINQITGQQWNKDFQPGVLMVYVLIGFVLAMVQLPILWRHIRGSALWLLASMMGWLVLGLIVGVLFDRTSDIFAFEAIPAIFTGFGLIWLMRIPRSQPGQVG
jgi:hypothetical protein